MRERIKAGPAYPCLLVLPLSLGAGGSVAVNSKWPLQVSSLGFRLCISVARPHPPATSTMRASLEASRGGPLPTPASSGARSPSRTRLPRRPPLQRSPRTTIRPFHRSTSHRLGTPTSSTKYKRFIPGGFRNTRAFVLMMGPTCRTSLHARHSIHRSSQRYAVAA